MLRSYLPIYEIALRLGALKHDAGLLTGNGGFSRELLICDQDSFRDLLAAIPPVCSEHGLTYTSELATRISTRTTPKTYAGLFPVLNSLNDTLTNELEKEAIFRIPPERKEYYGRGDLFGAKVHTAFPSCATDIQNGGNCYALGQGDACVRAQRQQVLRLCPKRRN